MDVVAPLAVAAAVPLILNQIANSNPTQTGANAYLARQQTAAGRGLNPANVASADSQAFGPHANALQPGTNITDYGKQVAQSAAMTVNELTAIKQDSIADVRLGEAALAEQKRATAHAASERTIAQIAGTNHNFLELFRGGSAKAAVKLFPAEYNYLSTVSAQTKQTAVYASGLRQDITALKAAEVGATGAQKAKLDADIARLQGLVQDTTAAVKNVSIKVLENIQNVKDQGSSIKVSATVTAKQNSAAAAKSKSAGSPGAKPI